ncbi:MAG: hypothetical protein HY517_03190 [Candidatus Aenigmarchaeota archaeon]|nr:hypothetical protein [Candidatus Aenigmarchaeota archaeon]
MDEQTRMKDYFLELAVEYEKKGFPFTAAEIYKRFSPAKGKRLYTSIARDAQKKGLLVIAAEACEAAGNVKKSRHIWKKLSEELRGKGLDLLAKEALEKSMPENPRYAVTRKFARAAFHLTRHGKFREAQKQWVESAKFLERQEAFSIAALHYFNGGDIRNAKRVWSKARKHI